MINTFIRKNLNISKERISRPVELGGLGFYNLSSFLSAQRCCWIFRAKKLVIDNWRYDLFCASPINNILSVRESDIDVTKNPVILGIVKAYSTFYSMYSTFESNYADTYIFENSCFVRADNVGRKLDKNFFSHNFYERKKLFLRQLKYKDCFRDGNFKSLDDWMKDGLHLLATCGWASGTLLC
jgi:hypothetical protein